LGRKKVRGLFSREVEGIVNRFVPIPDGKNFLFPTVAVALLTADIGRRQEVHLDSHGAGPVTSRAAARAGIVGKMGGGEAGLLGLRQSRVKGTQFVHQAEVRGHSRARSFADRGLVDLHHPVDRVHPGDRLPEALPLFLFGGGGEEDFVEEGALAGAAHPGEGHESVQG